MSCGCHSFFTPVKNPVLYCTITLCICTVARHYLDVPAIKGQLGNKNGYTESINIHYPYIILRCESDRCSYEVTSTVSK